MTYEWARERELAARQPVGPFKTDDDFLELSLTLTPLLTSQLANIAEVVLGTSLLVLQQQLEELVHRAGLPGSTETVSMLLTLACAKALAKAPTIDTWQRIKTLARDSWEIEHWLVHALNVEAQSDQSVRTDLVRLACVLFQKLDEFSLAPLSERYKTERQGVREHWQRCEDKLDELWWDLRWSNQLSYEEDFPLLSLIFKFSQDEFIRLLGTASNPNLVQSALVVTGAGPFTPRFSDWSIMARSSPVAFAPEGHWTGSLLAPLLLVAARNELHQTIRHAAFADDGRGDTAAATQEIERATRAVAASLSVRPDALALFSRWSAWLMRNLLGSPISAVNLPKTAEFVDNALLVAIGEQMRGQNPFPTSPPDAAAWEPWCHLCALASHASNGFISPPNPDDFLGEWALPIDDWGQDRGRRFREHASLIITVTKETPGLAGHLLAFAVVQSPDAGNRWLKTWGNAQQLREIVEFGDADDASNGYSSRVEASKLLLLLFRVGLAILDQKISQNSQVDSSEARLLIGHFAALSHAANEMAEIDDTINGSEWGTSIQHLATRRFIWEQPTEVPRSGEAIFLADDRPTFIDHLIRVKSNPLELMQLLYSVALNKPDPSRFKQALNEALVNFPETVSTLRRLNRFDARRYPIDEARLRGIAALIDAPSST